MHRHIFFRELSKKYGSRAAAKAEQNAARAAAKRLRQYEFRIGKK